MKKIVIVILILLTSLIFISCEPLFWNPPVKQLGTIWESENPQMYFYTDRREHMGNIGRTRNNLVIKLNFDFNFEVTVYDNNKIVYDEKGADDRNALMFRGKGKFKKKFFTITVTNSQIDSINVGDEIIFHRVEELPEWAREIEELLE